MKKVIVKESSSVSSGNIKEYLFDCLAEEGATLDGVPISRIFRKVSMLVDEFQIDVTDLENTMIEYDCGILDAIRYIENSEF